MPWAADADDAHVCGAERKDLERLMLMMLLQVVLNAKALGGVMLMMLTRVALHETALGA